MAATATQFMEVWFKRPQVTQQKKRRRYWWTDPSSLLPTLKVVYMRPTPNQISKGNILLDRNTSMLSFKIRLTLVNYFSFAV